MPMVDHIHVPQNSDGNKDSYFTNTQMNLGSEQTHTYLADLGNALFHQSHMSTQKHLSASHCTAIGVDTTCKCSVTVSHLLCFYSC